MIGELTFVATKKQRQPTNLNVFHTLEFVGDVRKQLYSLHFVPLIAHILDRRNEYID